MNNNDFARQAETAHCQVSSSLHLHASGPAVQHVSLPTEFDEELLTSLEKLRAAEEQLRQQNQELVTVRKALAEERQRYHDLFEFAPDNYLVTDMVGTIREANRAAAMLLNVSQQFLVGKPLITFVTQERRQYFQSELNQLGQQVYLNGASADDAAIPQKQQEWKVCLQPDNGKPFDAVLTVAFVRESEGTIALRWVLWDLTERKQVKEALLRVKVAEATNQELEKEIVERKRAEAALRESEERFRVIAEAIPVPVLICRESDGLVLYANAQVGPTFGFSAEEVMGLKTPDFYCDPAARQVLLGTLKKDGYLHNCEIHARKVDGTPVWIAVSARFLKFNGEQATFGAFYDITERKRTEEALRKSEKRYQNLYDRAPDMYFSITADGTIKSVNQFGAEYLGYCQEELTDGSVWQLIYEDDRKRLREQISEIFSGTLLKDINELEFRKVRKDGSMIWVHERIQLIFDETSKPVELRVICRDITERKRAEIELHKRDSLLQGVAEATNHLLTNTDYGTAITKALATLGAAAGVDRVYIYKNHPDPLRGTTMSLRFEWTRETIAPTVNRSYWHQPWGVLDRWYNVLSSGSSIIGLARELPETEWKFLHQDGTQSILLVPIRVNDQFWGYIGFDDCHSERRWSKSEESILVTMAASIGEALKRQRAEATIRYQAFYDLLTGLPNRALFNEQLSLALANAHQNGAMLVVIFLDLDRFKTINDTLGHAVGDQLLQSVAERLTGCLREGDIVARWGGDEFTLLLTQISCIEDATKVAQRILEASKPAFDLEGHKLHVSTSIGIALYPRDGEDAQTLLRHADAALYRAKEQGRNNYQLYTPAINPRAFELLALENRLYQALEQGEFLVYYQPQVNVKTWEITQVEALLRWQHSELGLVLPSTFIPLAEETGLIVPICEWVMQTACAQTKVWQEAGLPRLRLAINLSARQFQQPKLDQMVAQVLEETRLEPGFLELEITETTAVQDVDFTSKMLHNLHQIGVHLAMDDFGIGYSSLSYLKRFPFDTIKLDQSFTQELTTDPRDAAIAAAVIALGRSLNLSVVAEGVTTKEQLDCLRSLQCEEMQGYLFSSPLPTEETTKFLQAYQLNKANLFAALGKPFQAQPT